MTPYAITALALAALLAAAAVHCIRRAAHHLRAIQRERAGTAFITSCDELLAAINDTQPGRDENARELLEEMWRRPAAKERNAQPRKEEL